MDLCMLEIDRATTRAELLALNPKLRDYFPPKAIKRWQTDDLEPLTTALWQIESIKVAVSLIGMGIVYGLYLHGTLVSAVFDNALLVASLS